MKSVFMKAQQHSSTCTEFIFCGECHQTFSKISKLKKHSLEKHNKPLILSCSVCQKEFRTKSKLERHFASHESPVTHSCENCGKTFKHKRDMERHQEQHTEEKKTKLKCKSFTANMTWTDMLKIYILQKLHTDASCVLPDLVPWNNWKNTYQSMLRPILTFAGSVRGDSELYRT